MTREEQIKKVAEFQYEYIGSTDEKKAFKQGMLTGAEWADKNPNGSLIKWQTGVPKEEGVYIVTTDANEVECFVRFSPNSKECVNIFKDDVIAWCPLSDIEPYTESERPFKIGDLVVENRITGVVVELQNEGMLKVIGAALIKMHFTESMCRKATPEEALAINARWREQGVYYDIKGNKFEPYK